MTTGSPISRQIEQGLERLRAGDPQAREELLQHAHDRLRRLARKMLGTFPGVHRWEQTDDVFQNASLRLYRALETVVPACTADFFRLATTQIRRELIDLSRHYFGPRGKGAHHATVHHAPGSASSLPPQEPAAEDDHQSRLSAWTEFHNQAAQLPDEEREVFDLLWYQGLTQEEAAQVLGVSDRTVKRRWQAARLHLYDALKGQIPEP